MGWRKAEFFFSFPFSVSHSMRVEGRGVGQIQKDEKRQLMPFLESRGVGEENG